MLPEHAGRHIGGMRYLRKFFCALSRQRESSRCPYCQAGWGESLQSIRRSVQCQSLHLHSNIPEWAKEITILQRIGQLIGHSKAHAQLS